MKAPHRQVIYRLYNDNDYEALTEILADQWYPHLDHKYAMICAAAEVDVHLAHTTHAITAEVDGKVMGVSFARWQDSTRTWERLEHMRDLVNEYKDEIDVVQEIILLRDENNLMRRVVAEHGGDSVGALELLIVSPEARGLGIGKSLFQQNTQWLKEQGAKAYRLTTDDDCDWGFYEYIGMVRKGELVASITETQKLDEPFRIYVYEGSLED